MSEEKLQSTFDFKETEEIVKEQKGVRFTHIAVEGPIGVGKTTLAKNLAEELEARLILESAVDNPFLPEFYKNPDNLAFQTQLYFLVSRYKQLTDLFQTSLFSERTVLDYIFQKDRIFASMLLTPSEMELYNRLEPILSERLPKPDVVIYLHAEVETLMKRIGERGIGYEQKIHRSYIEKLRSVYQEFFYQYTDTPLLVVNTNDIDYATSKVNVAELLKELESFDSGTLYYVPVVEHHD